MLKDAVKKIKLAPKGLKIAFIVALTGLFLLAFIAGYEQKANAPEPDFKTTDEAVCLKQQDENCGYRLEVSYTNSQRLKGLSDREELAENAGMLFIFDQPADQCIWMKDMKFNLDILWLNEQKQIIRLEKDVSPDTYPESFCQDGTKYVIELNSFEAENSGYKVGDQLIF